MKEFTLNDYYSVNSFGIAICLQNIVVFHSALFRPTKFVLLLLKSKLEFIPFLTKSHVPG